MRPISDLSTPPSPNGKEVLVPTSAATWQQWLADNADRTEGVWVVYRKAKAPLEGPVYPELLDEALCAGWIDSRVAPVDDERTMQWFSPRRKGSIWSARNRARIAVLQEEGRLTETGRAVPVVDPQREASRDEGEEDRRDGPEAHRGRSRRHLRLMPVSAPEPGAPR